MGTDAAADEEWVPLMFYAVAHGVPYGVALDRLLRRKIIGLYRNRHWYVRRTELPVPPVEGRE
jgi:hypothetical protein